MEETAYHEAGHALMAEAVGARVRSVTIEPEPDDEQPRHGETEVAWKRSRWTEREYHEKAIQVALGGPVVEMLYTGDPYHPEFVTAWAADWQTAVELAMPLFPDLAKRIEYLEQVTRRLYHWLNTEPQWSAVAALADELLAQETLDGPAVREVLSAWGINRK